MTIEYVTKAFKTKLKVDYNDYKKLCETVYADPNNPNFSSLSNHQSHAKLFFYLMRIGNACIEINNWYVSTALKKMKEDGVTVFTPSKELKKYSPREIRKEFTVLTKTDSQYAKYMRIPAVSRALVFEHLEKTFKSFTKRCYAIAKEIEEKIEKEEKRLGRPLTEKELKEIRVFKGKKKKHQPEDLYFVKGFPRYKSKRNKDRSFSVDSVKNDSKNQFLIIPGANGSKKFNIPKQEPVKVYYHDNKGGSNCEGTTDASIFTFTFNGSEWFVSVSQNSPIATVEVSAEDLGYLGADIGIKKPVTFSNGEVFLDLSKDPLMKRYLGKLKALDSLRKKNRLKSPKIIDEKAEEKKNKATVKKEDSARYINLTKHINRLLNKIAERENALLKQEAARIIKPGLKGVVFEDINLNSWKGNKKWTSKLQKSSVGRIRLALRNRAQSLNIPVYKAPKHYASTQICSHCGTVNKSVAGINNLSKRKFICEKCGFTINRDLNAAINLANLGGSSTLKLWDEKVLDKN